MNRSSLVLFLFLGAATFCFQAISGVGIGLLEIPLKCYMRLDPGEGNQNLTRYHYNDKTSVCYRFNYRGHKGNKNNFQSLDECIKVCKGLPSDNAIPSNLIMTTPGFTKVSTIEGKHARNNVHINFKKVFLVLIRYMKEILFKRA